MIGCFPTRHFLPGRRSDQDQRHQNGTDGWSQRVGFLAIQLVSWVRHATPTCTRSKDISFLKILEFGWGTLYRTWWLPSIIDFDVNFHKFSHIYRKNWHGAYLYSLMCCGTATGHLVFAVSKCWSFPMHMDPLALDFGHLFNFIVISEWLAGLHHFYHCNCRPRCWMEVNQSLPLAIGGWRRIFKVLTSPPRCWVVHNSDAIDIVTVTAAWVALFP